MLIQSKKVIRVGYFHPKSKNEGPTLMIKAIYSDNYECLKFRFNSATSSSSSCLGIKIYCEGQFSDLPFFIAWVR